MEEIILNIIFIWIAFLLFNLLLDVFFEFIVKPIGYFVIWIITELEYFNELKKLKKIQKNKNYV